MKLFTKILCLALCLCMVASLAACGNNTCRNNCSGRITKLLTQNSVSSFSSNKNGYPRQTSTEVIPMAKQGMKRPDWTKLHPKNEAFVSTCARWSAVD